MYYRSEVHVDLKTATDKARQILDEELSAPTVDYDIDTASPATDTLTASVLAAVSLTQLRSRRPRRVLDRPFRFRFKSVNHDLLRALLSELPEEDRPAFADYVKERILHGPRCRRAERSTEYPMWHDLASELPLVVEFLVRDGYKDHLFSALKSPNLKVTPGYVLLLMQIEDLVALDYTAFSDSEYARLQSAVIEFGSTVQKVIESCATNGAGGMRVYGSIRYDGIDISLLKLRGEITEVCSGIAEECRKAQYLYLKGSLLEGLNIEVNQDKMKVEGFLSRFGFAPVLAQSLSQADQLYNERATPFDFKSCVGHLRSFLENLHIQAMPKIHAKYGGVMPTKWGGALAYLLQNQVLSKSEEQFASSFYTLISDEGIHPLVAEREYARLARNMVVEYALLFLTKLDKLGVMP